MPLQSVVSSRKFRRVPAEKPVRGAATLGVVGRAFRFVGTSIVASPAWTRRMLLLSLVALIAIVGFCGYQSYGKVTNGVIVAGVPVGGLAYDDARAALDERARQFDEQRVTLRFRDTSWQPTLGELGVTLDTESAWSAIVSFGSGRHLIDRSLRALHLQSAPIALGTPLRIDPPSLEAYCVERMNELGLAPVDAELTMDGDSIRVTDDSNGLVVSVDRLQQDLVRGLNGFTAPTIDLVATLAPASIRSNEVEPQIAALGSALEEPLRLYTDTDQWEIAPRQIAEHISLQEVNGQLKVVIDEDAIGKLVDNIADDIDRPVTDASIDDSGLYGRIIVPQDGVIVDRDELNKRIHESFISGQNEIEIPTSVTAGSGDIDTLLNDYGITDLIATGSSSFAGSDSGRSTNVHRAAELIDGTLVAPGDVFSFNQALGAIVDDGGFVPAGASEGGIPGTSVGGGVCQVSTSIFRAALTAGLPIIEWYPHAYRSMYYEQDGSAPGFDASIQQPDEDPLNGTDLKFRNSTDGWILIRVTASSAAELEVTIYGQPPGYDVVIMDPIYSDIVAADPTPIEEIDATLPTGTTDLWQPARDGVTMIVHRTVYAADGTLLIDEDFVSYYQPQGPVYRVSTDMAGTAGIK
jgi:vancomycin resistance protein YoaR